MFATPTHAHAHWKSAAPHPVNACHFCIYPGESADPQSIAWLQFQTLLNVTRSKPFF